MTHMSVSDDALQLGQLVGNFMTSSRPSSVVEDCCELLLLLWILKEERMHSSMSTECCPLNSPTCSSSVEACNPSSISCAGVRMYSSVVVFGSDEGA